MISTLFRQIDLFGKPVKLNFDGKEKSKSVAGASFSLSFFGFVIWAIYQVGQDIIFRLDPKIITSEGFSENPDAMVISPNTFTFAFGLQDPNTFAHYINESIYTVDIKHTQLIREIKQDGNVEMKWRRTVLALERCTIEHFGDLGPSFKNIELNELYCLQKEQPGLTEIMIQGVFESPIFQDISINFKSCDPSTSTVACAPKAILDKMLGSGYFAVYYTNRAINPKNYSNPSIGYRDSYYTSISNTYMKEITLSLSHLEIKSDIGWLTKDVKIDHYIRADNLRESVNLNPNAKNVMSFLLRVAKITTYYERSYTKVQDIFAEANGLATAGLIIVFIFLAPYSKIKFYERLINELFDIKSLQQQNKNDNQKNASKLVHKKNSIKSTSDEKLRVHRRQATLKSQILVQNVQSPSLIPPKNLLNLSKVNLTDDEENKSCEQPAPDPASRHQSRPHLNRTRTFHLPILDTIDLKSIQIEKEEKILNYSEEQYSRPSKSANESVVNLNINTGREQYENSPEKGLSDRKGRSFKNQLLLYKPKAIQPQIKVLENYDIAGPIERQSVYESFIDQQEQKSRKSEQYLEESQASETRRNTKIVDNLGKPIQEDNVKVIKISAKSIQEDDEERLDELAEDLPAYLHKDVKHINISFKEYICSYFWRSSLLKEKFGLLEEGIKRIEERLDIFNVLKKFREVDKLKLLLLENEQYVLFDTLPKPELSLKITNTNQERKSFSHSQLKEAKFINEKRKNDLIAFSYKSLKKKTEKTMIDEKLLEIYDDILSS